MDFIRTTIAGVAVAGLLTFGATTLTPSTPQEKHRELERQGSHLKQRENKRLRDENGQFIDSLNEESRRPRIRIRFP